MVSIYQLTGYKYIGERPGAPIGHNTGLFRDNLTYINASFSDWKADREKILFIFEEHISYLNIDIFDNLFASHLSNNSIPQLHIVIKEHTDETEGQTALMVTKGDNPDSIFLKNGEQQENILDIIARKKKFYNTDLPYNQKLERMALLKPKRTSRKKIE
jgi:hypothetical protein